MTTTILLLTILAFVFLIGTCIGSFLNVVVLRAFSDESICFPGSKCPSCQKPLKWYHNIPILSYLILKGKCGFCETKISIQYPIIEFLTGLFFILLFFKFGFSLNALFLAAFGSLFIVIAATDIKEKVIFDVHTYILIALGLIYNFFNIGNLYYGVQNYQIANFAFSINESFYAAIGGIIVGVLIMEAFARFGYLVAGERAFGEGDSYIAAALGAIFGLQYLIMALAYSLLIQVMLTIPVYIKKLFTKKDFTTIYLFIAFFALIIVLKYIDYNFIEKNLLLYGILSLILCGVGIYLCKRILGKLKQKDEMTYLPFGPAMVAAAFILFFIN